MSPSIGPTVTEVQPDGGPRRGRALLVRLLSLLVLAAAVWVVARNVSWHDTLHVGAHTLHGELQGDWRAEEVTFVVSPQEPREPLPLAPLAALAAAGGTVAATAAGLAQGGAALDVGGLAVSWTPGIPHTLDRIEARALIAPFLWLVLSTLFVVTRWWRLLRFEGCRVSWVTAFRFTYIGLFFNSFIPGLNGGDVARAIAVVRDQPENRTSALMTVLVDRALGLVAMVLMATAVVLMGDHRLDPLKVPVAGFCALMLAGLALYVTPWARRLVRFDALLAKLPGGERLARLDGSARRLLGHPGEVAIALLLSFGNHATNAAAVIASARALGSALGVSDWLTVMTISNTLAAVPISPGGLGVGEVLFGSLAALLGGAYVVGVATSILYRIELLGLAALGGIVMVVGGRRLREGLAEARREALAP